MHYYVEFESFPKSGRWFRGLISDEILPLVEPETALTVLEKLEWYFYGGSFFGGRGKAAGLIRSALIPKRFLR